jgi:hypothetical protein
MVQNMTVAIFVPLLHEVVVTESLKVASCRIANAEPWLPSINAI